MMKPQMMITFMLLILSHLAAQNQKKRRLDVPYVVSYPNKPVKNHHCDSENIHTLVSYTNIDSVFVRSTQCSLLLLSAH